MQCKLHPSVEAVVNCLVCNTPLCNDCIANNNSAAPQCEKCISFDSMADVGEKNVTDAEKRRKQIKEASQKPTESKRQTVQITIIIIASLLVPIQYFRTFGMSPAWPLDKTDKVEMTDLCIASMLKISRLLQQDILPGNEYRCPLSNHPYEVTHEGTDIIVSDPNPELHGFTEFSASKNYPEPVFSK